MSPTQPAPGTPGTLPVRVRRITLAVITLSGLVGFASAQHLAQVMELEQLRNLDPIPLPFDTMGTVQRGPEAAAARLQAQVHALESMRAARALTLLALTISSTLTFVGALRMLRPGGAAREDVRRLLAGTAIACAVLRTIDGAQLTAIARRVGAASDKVMLSSDVPGGYPALFMQTVLSATSIATTLVVVVGFLGAAMYFRSTFLRAVIEAADRAREET